tara:strand:- start:425 stop:1270 length:846 start_codon:yes stop_codon:yes gene_type:complete
MKLRNCKYTAASGGCSLLNHPEMNQLDCMWNCGFYSNQSQAFLSTLILLSHGIVPDKISYAMGFKRFKSHPDKDIFPDFYKINPQIPVQLLKTVTLPDENRKQFDLYDFEYYNQVVNKFFGPSDLISERKQLLLSKYKIDPSQTIAVLYRGTDKFTEVRLGSPEAYLNVTKQLLNQTGFKKVLVQTDQTQVLDYFKQELGDKVVVHFEETPSTSGQDAMNTVMENEGKDTMDWMQWFDAALRCVSDCAVVVNHTGNCGLWMNLYRGNTVNVFQFDQFGNLS